MVMRTQIYDPAEWCRAGRGLELQFYATDTEVQQWLGSLPTRYGPYTVWGSRLTKQNNKYRRVTFSYSLDEWLRVPDSTATPDQFFLHAEALMPKLPLGDNVAQHANEWASLNGLVLVQHGATRSGQQLVSRISMTDRIRNRSTGELKSLKDRTALFGTLRKMIEGQLCFTTVQVFKDGHEEEDRVQLMTAAAADLAGAGFFVRRPDRRLT